MPNNFCIVSEFNPLHSGHKYLLDEARALGADTVTAIMSGNATQRGELAITDKYLRAQAAIECGADLVLELPYPWCASSADYFACAALYIASKIGDTLLFGSECGDIDYLQSAARHCEAKDFKDDYEALTKSGIGSAAAYVKCLAERGFTGLCSNDLLGISYLRAIMRYSLPIKAITVKRKGAAYNEEDTVKETHQSATAMRIALLNQDFKTLEKYLPEPMLNIVKQEAAEGRITDVGELDSAIITFFRLCDREKMQNIADAQGGLANRIINCALQSTSLQMMYKELGTKRYTDAKLRRAMLFMMTSVTPDMLSSVPEYTCLLGADAKGRRLVAEARKAHKIKIITKPADAPRDTSQFIVSEKLDLIYELARKEKLSPAYFMQKKAYIMK